MGRYSKQVKHQNAKTAHKSTVQRKESSENSKSIWLFDKIDKNGKFAFDINRPDFQHKDFLAKMINYSKYDMGRNKINKLMIMESLNIIFCEILENFREKLKNALKL